MKFGLPVLFSYVVQMTAAGSEGRTGHPTDGTVRALDQEWILNGCAFAEEIRDLPHEEMVLVHRSYDSVGFEKVITVDDRSFDNAHALLLERKEEMDRRVSLSRRSTHEPGPSINKFYSMYSYGENEDKKVADEKLLIPRYIKTRSSVHRLAIVNIIECKDHEGIMCNLLQLSYEDVPGQCRCSPLFKESQMEVVKERYEKIGKFSGFTCERCGDTEVPDSDGDQNIVKLGVATTLSEWLGKGVYTQVGRGGYSTSHEGMVHAFLHLTRSSLELVRSLMEENTLGPEELESERNREFIRTKLDMPSSSFAYNTFLYFLNLGYFVSGYWRPDLFNGCTTYRAIISNHRQRSEQTSCDRLQTQMTLIPVRTGVLVFGRLKNDGCFYYNPFDAGRKHTKNMIFRYSSETPGFGSPRVMDSQRHRVLRNRTAFVELMLDVDAKNAAELERSDRPRRERDAAISKFVDDAGEKMEDAERKVKEGIMEEAEYVEFCNGLRDEYSSFIRGLN